MAPDKEKAERTVFVGNIPYGLTEEQIIHILGQVGQVLNFRLIYDTETGRPKGFGFAEYADSDSAASAVRNLHGYETMGRELRVAKQDNKGDDDQDADSDAYVPQLSQPSNGTYAPPQPQPSQQSAPLPPLPPGADLAPGLTCPDAISRTLSTLPAPQLLDILSQMKGLVMDDPNKATELFKQAPQLSYAIFQALLLMGLVDASALQSVIEQTAAQAQQPSQPTPQPAQSLPFPPPQPQPYQPVPTNLGQMHVATPPVQSQTYAPPPPQQPPQPAQALPPGVDKTALFQYVLSMSQEQLNALAPAERDQILGVKAQILSGALRL
ncbi:MAG: hypothetical protein M1837_003563 [Sclerophora amabilis]|nr:MAG: hypothetical protein M1837_003563 [Sclerophora amabilis]